MRAVLKKSSAQEERCPRRAVLKKSYVHEDVLPQKSIVKKISIVVVNMFFAVACPEWE